MCYACSATMTSIIQVKTQPLSLWRLPSLVVVAPQGAADLGSSMKAHFCTVCGKQIERHSRRCRSCANKARGARPRNRWVLPDGSPRFTLEERLWSRIQRGNPEECWLWMGYVGSCGYGYIGLGGGRHGKIRHAHHVTWEVVHKRIVPPGMEVCHSCDNPRCCNPAHLWLGTHAENMADRKNKGRAITASGELNASAKLSQSQVDEIRKLLAEGHTTVEIGRRYGVTQACISHIATGRTWRTVHDKEHKKEDA